MAMVTITRLLMVPAILEAATTLAKAMLMWMPIFNSDDGDKGGNDDAVKGDMPTTTNTNTILKWSPTTGMT